MVTLALITSVILLLLALLHGLWAAEVWWPIRDERRLVSAVVGFKEATRMPGAIPCMLVTLVLTVCAAMIWLPDGLIRQLGMWIAMAMFAVRGGLAYLPQWRRLATQQPFARNDRLFYGPLCLSFAIAFWWLSGWG